MTGNAAPDPEAREALIEAMVAALDAPTVRALRRACDAQAAVLDVLGEVHQPLIEDCSRLEDVGYLCRTVNRRRRGVRP